MTISVLQVASSDLGTSATSTTQAFSSNVTAGSWIVAITMGNFAGTVNSVTDTLGNTYTLRQTAQSSAGPGNQKLYLYTAYSPSGGANSVTFNYAVSTSFRPAYLLEIGGTASAAYDGSNSNDQTAPTTGTDQVVSGTATNATQPAMIVGAAVTSSGSSAAGTGFTAQTGNWLGAGSGYHMLAEVKRITTTGAQQATWTASLNTERMSVMVILDELQAAPATPFTMTQWFVNDQYQQ